MMKMMKVLVTDNTHSILQEELLRAGFSVDIRTDLDYHSLLEIVNGYDGLVVRSKINIDKTFLDHCTRLKCIGREGQRAKWAGMAS